MNADQIAAVLGFGSALAFLVLYVWARWNLRHVRRDRDAARFQNHSLRHYVSLLAKQGVIGADRPDLAAQRLNLALWTGEMDPETCLLAEELRSKDGEAR